MEDQTLQALRFPIGEFIWPKNIQKEDLNQWIKSINDFPETLIQLTNNTSIEQLNIPYRPKGWKLKQVVHHCADSHMSSIKRFKLALTENDPLIRPYPEHLFAELVDAVDDDISDSLAIIKSVHRKWVQLLNHMKPEDFDRTFVHPEYKKIYNLSEATALYSWHCEHHLGHVRLCLENA